jgi:Lsr2
MAREIVYTDDLDGTHGAEPVRFTWDSVEWEIDLAEANRKKLEEALRPFLDKAHPANVAQARSTTTRTRRASTEGKIDYSSPEFAGNPHRGRVTEAEAAYVRDNFDAVNKRLSAEGKPMLDPSDPKTKKRYGL